MHHDYILLHFYDIYLLPQLAWGNKGNQAFLGAEYHDFDLHIGPMKGDISVKRTRKSLV